MAFFLIAVEHPRSGFLQRNIEHEYSETINIHPRPNPLLPWASAVSTRSMRTASLSYNGRSSWLPHVCAQGSRRGSPRHAVTVMQRLFGSGEFSSGGTCTCKTHLSTLKSPPCVHNVRHKCSRAVAAASQISDCGQAHETSRVVGFQSENLRSGVTQEPARVQTRVTTSQRPTVCSV